MLIKRLLLSLIIGSTSAITLTACNDTDDHVESDQQATPDAASQNIVGLAQSRPDLSVLVEAVSAAGLVDTLSASDKKFTIFAPTNDAFTTLLSDLNLSKDQLIANKDLLTQVLTYHALATEVKKADIPFGKFITSVEGNGFVIDDQAMIKDAQGNTAKITETDLMATNGVVHVIDKVILPPNKDIVDIAASNDSFSILVAAVTKAGLGDTLKNDGPFTVFAPTDAAFAAALTELNISKEDLLARADLADILKYHVVGAKAYSSALPLTGQATVQGEKIDVSADAKITDANGRVANIIATDIQATNGVIHVVDKVILPKL